MSYVMFLMVELLGFAVLYLTYKGVFGLLTAFLVVILMLGLSFHILVRKPDAMSIRMACLTAVLWAAAIFSGNLLFEFRSLLVSTAAFIVLALTSATAGAATYALFRRPLEVDVGD